MMNLLILLLISISSIASASLLSAHRDVWVRRIRRLESQLERVPQSIEKEQRTLEKKRIAFTNFNCDLYLVDQLVDQEPADVSPPTSPFQRLIATMDEENCFERISTLAFPFIWDLADEAARKHVCESLFVSTEKTEQKLITRINSFQNLILTKFMYESFINELEQVMMNPTKFPVYVWKWISNEHSVYARLLITAAKYEHFVSVLEDIIMVLLRFRRIVHPITTSPGWWRDEERAAQDIAHTLSDIYNNRSNGCDSLMHVLAQIAGRDLTVPSVRNKLEQLTHRLLAPFRIETQELANAVLNAEKAALD